MDTDSPGAYRRQGLQVGVASEVLEEATRQMQRLRNRGVTPIYSLKHLAHHSGISYLYLREIVQRIRDPYSEFSRPKKDRIHVRTIAVPDPPLMSVQRWLLAASFGRLSTHPASYAYERNKSAVACASRHLGARWLLKFDLRSFFHSVDERAVFRAIHSIGYNRLVALELARVCTRYAAHSSEAIRQKFIVRSRERGGVESYTVPYLGFLPQGAPTSGALANLVARPLDESLTTIAHDAGLVYTRYADDLAFSTAADLNRSQAADVVRQVAIAVRQAGFQLHRGKTKVVPPGARKIVLGVLVDGDIPRLTVDARRRLENHVRGVAVFGLSAHVQSRGYSSMTGLVNHVDGLLAAAHAVDRLWASRVRGHWEATLRAEGWASDERWHWQ